MNPGLRSDALWLTHSGTPKSLRITAAALAFGVHAIFVVLMLLSVNWKTQDAAPVAVEMWSPAEMAPSPVLPEVQPMPVVHNTAAAVPPPVPQAVRPVQPDIALARQRELQDKLKRKAEQEKLAQQKLVQGKLAQEEKLAQEKLVQEKLVQQAKIRQAQLAQQKMVAEKMAAEKRKQALQKLMAQQTASEFSSQSAQALNNANQASRQQAGMLQEFKDKIRAKIRSRIILPEGLQGNPEAIFVVSILPSGEVVRVSLQHSSGQPVYDDAVQRAILKASPLPVPPDAVLAGQFRELNLHFSPQDH